MSDRVLRSVHRGDGFHWVGDGFYVTQVLPGSHELHLAADPFLMLDYQAPKIYPATNTPRGVGVHPHRGFETVTIAFEGRVAHHDSTGAGGVIGPGDVQWMTAASGVLHKEYHEAEWAKSGGMFHMMQLWVNLPGKHKMDPPGYQALLKEEMGRVDLTGGGNVTLIAGELNGVRGPARTFTPIELWDVRLGANEHAELEVTDGHTEMVFPIEGEISTIGGTVGLQSLGVFERNGDRLVLDAGPSGARVIVLGGQPINENVIFHGPFAMNTVEEINQAIEDFNAGKFGQLV